MADAIIAAIITGGISLIGIILTHINAQKKISSEFEQQNLKFQARSEMKDQKLEAKIEQLQALTDMKIEELTREVRMHNNFAQRIPVLESEIQSYNQRIPTLENEIKSNQQKITALESKIQ